MITSIFYNARNLYTGLPFPAKSGKIRRKGKPLDPYKKGLIQGVCCGAVLFWAVRTVIELIAKGDL